MEKPTKKPNSQAELVKALNVAGVKALEEWLTSGMFKEFWVELWEKCLLQKAAKSNDRGVQLSTAQQRLTEGEQMDRRKYSRQNPDKTDWDECDHLAWFLWWVKNENSTSNEGVFFGRDISESDKELILWGVKDYVRRLHAPSQLKKTGGVSILGTGRRGKHTPLR